MKIEIGKKYKSNVCYRAGPRQADNSQELYTFPRRAGNVATLTYEVED